MKVLNDEPSIVEEGHRGTLEYTPTTVSKKYISNLPVDRIVITLNNGVKIPVEYVPAYGELPGVYIVSIVNLPYDNRFNHDDYITPIQAYVKNQDIKDVLKFKFSKQYPTPDLVTYESFISEEELSVHGDILLVNEDILISYNQVNTPFPKIDNVEANNEEVKYVIYSQQIKTFYLKVANSIKPIKSTQGRMVDGLYIYFKINGIDKKIYYPLDEISKGGVYSNRHEAMTNGNFKELLEVLRLENELMLLEAQVQTKVELMRLSVIKSEAEADIKISMAKQQQEIASRKSELENLTLDKKNLGFGLEMVSGLLTMGSKFI